uniref:Tc1-like transposase DDE domain-containing protein n=1 Tax=Monopterus albus TaxID=43700 RepID=A0A3Q3J3I1_MONAL
VRNGLEKVLFSDESHFFVQGQRSQHVRRSPTEKLCNAHIDQRVKHPQKKMFWGCFSYYGIGSLHPVEGMMRSPQYIEILRRKVAPELIKLFPDGSGVFQQDLAPCHTSKQVKNFFEENHINTLDWPGNSPDLNPIENLDLRVAAGRRNPSNLRDLAKEVVQNSSREVEEIH